MSQVPTIGRIVMYMLSPQDCDAINRRRTDGHAIKVRIDSEKWPLGAQAHIGPHVNPCEVYPALIVAKYAHTDSIGIRVFLNGTDDLWVQFAPGPPKDGSDDGYPSEGRWFWPLRDKT